MTDSTRRSELAAGRVESQSRDGVATVTFSHPKSNSMPAALLQELAGAIEQAGGDSETRVIVLQSGGEGVFCAGASFDEFRAVKDPTQGQRFFSGFARVILAMIRAPQFVVVRVQGKTAGGGVGLVAAGDYAIATRAAGLKLSELAVGIGPFVVGPVIEHKIGLAAMSAITVDADWRTAEWGAQQALYAEVVDDIPALDARVGAFAKKLAGYNPDAVRRLKEIFWRSTEHWESLMMERAAISGTMILSEYTRKAIGS